MNVLRHLNVGADAAVTLSELAERLGVPRRAVESQVQELRLGGVAVITGARGAYLAVSPQEARDMAERLRTRAAHQMATAAALERAADAMTAEPLTLFGEAA